MGVGKWNTVYSTKQYKRRENGKSSAMGVGEMENILNNGRTEKRKIFFTIGVGKMENILNYMLGRMENILNSWCREMENILSYGSSEMK